MVIPEFLAHVRQLDPGINRDRVLVAGLDQMAEIFVSLGIALPVMPGGDVQRADSRSPPARREVIQINPRAVGGIEKRPQARRPERRLETEIRERLDNVGEALITPYARWRSDPQNRSRPSP